MIRQFGRWVAPPLDVDRAAPVGPTAAQLEPPRFSAGLLLSGYTKELGPRPQCQSEVLPGGNSMIIVETVRHHHTRVRCSLFGGASAPGAGPGRVRILHVAQRGIGRAPDARTVARL